MFVKESLLSLDRWIWSRRVWRSWEEFGSRNSVLCRDYYRDSISVGEMDENGDSAGTHFVEASLISLLDMNEWHNYIMQTNPVIQQLQFGVGHVPENAEMRYLLESSSVGTATGA